MQTAYMPATTSTQATWRPRHDPGNISSANASMPPHPPQGYQGPWPPAYPPGYPGPPPAQLPSSLSTQQWSKGYWRFEPKATGWSSASGAPPQHPPQQQQYYNPGAINNNVPRPASQQAGAPPGWGQNWIPQGWQMPADHNPYKRIPKEPDPSYFSVELSENPLGLENMHIKRASRPQEKPFATPWRWVPEDLPADDDGEERETAPPNGHRPSSHGGPSSTQSHHISSASQQTSSYPSQHSKSQQPSGSREVEQYRLKGVKSPPILHPSSRRSTQEHTPPKDSSLYRSSSRRNAQAYTPPSDTSPHRSSSRRHPQEYTPPSDDQRQPSTLSHAHTHDDRSRRERERDREREKERRRGSDTDEQEHEAFSGKKELHPTFSPAIVRTPKYYSERTSTPSNATPTKSSSTRRASDGPVAPPHSAALPSLTRLLQENVPSVLSPLIGATPRPSSATMPGLGRVARDEHSSSSSSSSPSSSKDRDRVTRSHSRNHSRSNSLSKVDDKPHRSLHRNDTITSRTTSPPPYDEQQRSPTYYPNSSGASVQHPSRTVGRSQTYPTLNPVSENPHSSTRRDLRDGRESRNPPASISRASDAVKDLARSNSRTVGRSHTDPQISYNLTRATSPLRSRSPTRALSPPRSATPSRSSSRVPSRSHTPTSSAVIVPPVPVPPLPVDASHRYRTSSSVSRKVKVRAGYWNRRGDCLAHDRKYFVRAPREYRYPQELAHYPERDFFRYDGKRIVWTPEIRESPDSLPMHGRPPKYPFENFLQYIEVDESSVWRGH